jgi:hypothetical protein
VGAPSSYSQASYAALEGAYEAATTALARPAATLAELQTAYDALVSAIVRLEVAPDQGDQPAGDTPAQAAARAMVAGKLAELAAAVSTGRTAESWAAFAAAREQAQLLANDPSATPAQLVSVLAVLTTAHAALADVPGVQDTLKAPPITKVKAGQKAVRLAEGQTITIPALAYTATGQAKATLRWTSSKPSVVQVNAKTGKLRAKAKGSAKVTVAVKGGTAKYTINVKVATKTSSAKVTKVTAKPPKTMAPGARTTIAPTWKSASATKVKVTYSSSAPGVVTVDKAGTLVAKAPGKATITIKAGGKTAKYKITVK